MSRILIVALCTVCSVAQLYAGFLEKVLDVDTQVAHPDYHSTQFCVENDEFAPERTDRDYSSGIRFDWALFEMAKRADDAVRYRSVSYFFAMEMYTPEKTSEAQIQYDDRPYAGWSYIGMRHTLHSDDAWTISQELSIGLLGAGSGQESVQKTFHVLKESMQAQGWGNQIRNELTLQYSGRFYKRFSYGEHFALIPYGAADFGTVHVRAGAGSYLYFGWLPKIIVPASDMLPLTYYEDKKAAQRKVITPAMFKTPLSFYARVEAKAVAYNATVEGGMFSDMRGVDNPHTTGAYNGVLDAEIGAAAVVSEWGAIP